MKKEWFEWYVWDKVRVRIRIEKVKGKIIDILIQLEIFDKKWHEVIRYNYAHGKPHRDIIYKNGKKEKVWLGDKTLDEILTYAELDLKTNWKLYLKECGYIETD